MKKILIDQLGRTIEINQPPKRIISLVPSQTELLHYLGLNEEVVGITKFCVHPHEWFKSKTKVGGTKQYKFDMINALQPDLIIGNKEENDKEQIEALAEKYPIWMSDIKDLEDAYQMILGIGRLANKPEKAKELVEKLRFEFNALNITSVRKAAYFIWRKPFMVAASDTFINEMLQVAGFKNVFSSMSRYPEIALETLAEQQPEVILLSSEPYPFKEKHLDEFRKACPSADVKLVDGELFSWYGSRLLYAAKYFQALQK